MASSENTKRSPPHHLLGLPQHIRLDILRHSGLIHEFPIIMLEQSLGVSCGAYYNYRSCDLHERYESPTQIKYDIPCANIMYTCRTLYHDAINMFYSENSFKICTKKMNNWLSRSLPPLAWMHLKILEVEFADMHEPVYSFDEKLDEWREMCLVLSTVLKYHKRSDVRITFSLAGTKSTHEVQTLLDAVLSAGMAPFKSVQFLVGPWTTGPFEWVHGLACGMPRRNTRWNCPDRDNIKALLKTYSHAMIVNTATPTCNPQSSVSFSNLPVEIRLKVLSQTELAVRSQLPISGKFKKISECCGQCGGKRHEVFSSRSLCFCDSDYYLTYSSSCRCNPIRSSPLFAINRSIREQAFEVFYKQNQFIVSGSALEVLRQLESIPRYRLDFIRHLHIKFDNNPLYRSIHEPPKLLKEDCRGMPSLFKLMSSDFNMKSSKISITLNAFGDDYWLRSIGRPSSCRALKRFYDLLVSYGLDKVPVSIDTFYWPQLGMKKGTLISLVGPGLAFDFNLDAFPDVPHRDWYGDPKLGDILEVIGWIV
ncbi:hypothetical protein BT63DRAFT_424062 [Microthyrium microscopicum]|uniref:DUF7730 domain-containing protein n=1 Tax=Microthyrium microscopicum TaxID=703497 RepID=A0A6A6UF84_9PEZI|nr:hypothetical protein BT63DRAFT_424062 [Microthyrium microscopicum]